MPVSSSEWLVQNSQRAFPLHGTATRTDITGSFTIPNSLILEMYLPVHAGEDVDPEKFYVRSITIFTSGMSISLGYDDGSGNVIATASFSFSDHEEFDSYTLAGVGDFQDSTGKIVIGLIDDLLAQPQGQWFFDYEDGKLDFVVRPIIRGVSSIAVVNGSDVSDRLYGDVELIAGANVRLTVTPIDATTSQIRIDAIEGEGLTECECPTAVDEPCIKTINGIRPDIDGNLSIIGSACLEVSESQHCIQLVNLCATPCCGCPELTSITADLNSFEDGVLTLKQFLNRLEVSVTAMEQTVLGCQLHDVACVVPCLPYVNTFEERDLCDWTLMSGAWQFAVGSGGPADFAGSYLGNYGLSTILLSGTSVAVWCGCGTSTLAAAATATTGLIVKAYVKIPSLGSLGNNSSGSFQNAAIALNVNVSTGFGHAVAIDAKNNFLSIVKFPPLATLGAQSVAIDLNTWYLLEAIVTTVAGVVTITANVYTIPQPPIVGEIVPVLLATKTASAPDYGLVEGCYGVAALSSYAVFDNFIVEINP